MTPPARIWRISSTTGRVSATLRGVVREVGPDSYIVEIDGGALVIARLSARVRARGLVIAKGDEVRVECKAENMSRGTITSIRRTTT